MYAAQQLDIHGTTNLATGDQIQINVVSLGFTPTTKTQSNEFSAAAETVTVYHGNNSAYNEFNVSFDISNFIPGAYTAEAQSVTTGVGTTTSFNVLEGVPTPIPTPVPTTPPTPLPTPVPTTVPTTLPTTTPKPGFDPGITLSGLCAAAVLIVWRKR
jgi:S-layer glycoprotein